MKLTHLLLILVLLTSQALSSLRSKKKTKKGRKDYESAMNIHNGIDSMFDRIYGKKNRAAGRGPKNDYFDVATGNTDSARYLSRKHRKLLYGDLGEDSSSKYTGSKSKTPNLSKHYRSSATKGWKI